MTLASEFLHAAGLSLKRAVLLAELTRPDIARKRDRWKAHQACIDRPGTKGAAASGSPETSKAHKL